jgi:hypothetical protein
MKSLKPFFFAFILLSSCAHSVHQNSIGGFAPYAARAEGHVVIADVEEKIVFANFSKFEMLDQAYAVLLGKCPQGEIVGVSTRYLSSLGFFHWTEKIRLQGLCIQKKS